ncbi:uncharacterized protein LOC116015541 isoform X1 [Ipomoea triloba]|uniref:uncharacterized protein LOC116015541 isoform X1 n=1 Tax=Ipomoea triloba TaxID=35885 RepID=UPI00125E01C0|nr:uncharacterized protein LOC116015541 isoform X1 [Ipomoea triloba]
MVGCLMASRGFSPWLLLPQEQGTGRLSKEHLSFVPSPGTNQDILKPSSVNLRLQQKEDLWKTVCMLLDAKQIIQMNTYSGRPLVVDIQADSPSNSVLFSFGIAEQCRRHENVLKYLMSGSSEVDLSTLHDVMCPQALAMPESLSASSLAESQSSLIYPSSSFSLQIPPSDVAGFFGHDLEIAPLSDGRLCPSESTTLVEMKDILSIISEYYQLKNLNSINSGKQSLLVPYFDRKMTREAKAKPSTQKLESPESLKYKTSPKKKSNKKLIDERDLYRNNNLHACESLLSIMVDKKRQGRTAINSLKKSGSELPRFLTQFSAVIAGTGLAVLFSVACNLACGRVAFSAPKIFNTGLGLTLVWLSWGVNNLRDTVISISKCSGKVGAREEEMMNNLDKNVKEIYFRAAAFMAVAALRFI